MVERANVIIDEFVNENDKERKKEPKDYNKLVYIQDEEPNTILGHLTKSL